MNPRLKYLYNLITDNRKELFQQTLKGRTRHLTVVLEDIFQTQNASAVMRSCDVFGIQDIHVIENRNTYTLNPNVTLGSAKWINLHQYNKAENNTKECLLSLKAKGYKIVATSPHSKDHFDIHNLPLHEKTALVFGTEQDGITDEVKELADSFVTIPMVGFTESLNISVAAAVCIYETTKRIKSNPNTQWQLTDSEKEELLFDWCKKTIKRSDILLKEFDKRSKEE